MLDGRIALSVEATSSVFGVSPQFSLDTELIDFLASVFGAIIVLVAGSIWRARSRNETEHRAKLAAGEARRAD